MTADTPVIPVTPVTRTSMASREIDNGIDLRERLSFVWRHWKFILSITVLACVIGVIYLLHVTPLYTATAQILIDQEKESAPDGSKVFNDVNPNVALLENQMAIIRSTAFLRRVVDNDHLVATATAAAPSAPQADPPQNSLLSYVPAWVTSVFSQVVALVDGSPTAESDTPSPGVQVGADLLSADELNAIEGLRGSLGVSHAPNTGNVIAVSFTSPDPTAAAKLANDIANAFLVDKLDTRFEQAKRASAWLSDRLASLRQEVEDSEQAVTTFRAEHGLVQSGNITLNQQQLSDLNAKLIDAKADLAQKKACSRGRCPSLPTAAALHKNGFLHKNRTCCSRIAGSRCRIEGTR
jgi:succinoglycan biosynthesis transport protein ExoP